MNNMKNGSECIQAQKKCMLFFTAAMTPPSPF